MHTHVHTDMRRKTDRLIYKIVKKNDSRTFIRTKKDFPFEKIPPHFFI